MIEKVAALCVAPNSIYKQMPGVDAYDMARDVRTFVGGMPVVAHPPCRTWSAYTAHQAKAPPGEQELGLLCAEWLRREGGVLEHPAHSRLSAGRAEAARPADRAPVHGPGPAGLVGLPNAQGDVVVLLPR